ncbi:MAG TPA: biotin--[acetyl-CoA-carboxylase] ligase [Candidatus Limnocylindria bacterium]|nr:biotin--[acetyl-CoA-carboxylase] ligase [Candidatus Limnocylindria bacterium]
MSDSSVWQRAADPRRRIGRAVEFHAAIGSTNDRARALLAALPAEGTVVVADVQSLGRGRLGRVWHSPPGRNLLVSVPVRPALAGSRAWQLSAAAALAVREAAAPHAALAVRWPNDLVAADGLKVAGLLVETTLLGDTIADAVVGIGINVNWRRAEMPAELAARATSLADLAGEALDRVALLGRLLAALDRELAGLERGASPLARYRGASWLDGRRVAVRAGARLVEGRAAGIAADGALLVETERGSESVSYGEVIAVELPRQVPA